MTKLRLDLTVAISAMFFGLSTSVAQSAVIVDTGQPTGGYLVVLGGSPTNYGNQWLAGEFTIIGEYTITYVAGWMEGFGAGEELTIAIYTDGDGMPGLELYSQSVPGTGSGFPESWMGTSGLSWNLAAGTYWVSFERRDGQALTALMRDDPPDALSNYAARSPTVDWLESSRNLGVRISGDLIPEPSASLLFIAGLGSLGLRRRRN